MRIAIDLGGSTVDLISFDANQMIQQTISFESNQVNRNDLVGILTKSQIPLSKISDLRITGGFSLNLPNQIQNIPVTKIYEFDANGFGGTFLAKTNSALVVSLGTGTSMVKVIDGKIEHIGGTGVGGGTLIGLGKVLCQESDYQKIDQLAQQGDLKKIDLSVREIVGGNIGIIPANATASNFGKMINYSKEDLALGICNLVGETIGSLAYFASEKYNLEKIILIGKVTRLNSILKIIQNTSKIYNKQIIVPPLADYGTSIGAGLLEIINKKFI